MNENKCIGLAMLMGFIFSVGMLQAQEPELNIQAPATSPILDATPEEPAALPKQEVHVVHPVAGPAPLHAPVHHTEPHVVIHSASNEATHVATNVVVLPVAQFVTVHTNLVEVPTNEVVTIPKSNEFFVDTWKDPTFEVGTRAMQVKLKDKTRGQPSEGSFVGTITEITEEQDHSPDKFFLQLRLPKTPLWVGVSYDHVRAQTMDDSNGDGVPDSGGGDGAVDISGYVPYLQATWDNETRLTPFIEIGYAFYQSEFDANANWSNGGRKVMNLKSTSGFELAGGLGIRIYRNLTADVFVRQMKVSDVKGEYLMDGSKQSDIIFTMSYTAYGAGLSCRF